MGYPMGSTCSLRPPPLPHLSTFPSSSRKKPAAHAWSRRTDDDNFSAFGRRRREVLLLGASFVPPLLLLQLEATAEDYDATTTQKSPKAEEFSSQRDLPNHFSLLNGLGIFTSGTLGALYALGQREKQAADAAVESMRNSLKEKEAEILTLEQRYKAMARKEQQERTKEMRKSDEGKWSLMNHLNLANTTIYGLGQELKSEKNLVDELKHDKNVIIAMLSKAGEERRSLEENLVEKVHLVENLEEKISLLSSELKANEENLRGINSNLANKELEFIDMNSSYRNTKDELLKAQMEIENLNNHILSRQIDLESKIAEISTLVSEKDDDTRKLAAVEKELIDLASASDRKAALFEDTQKELCLLNEQLKHYQKVSAELETELSRIQAEYSEESSLKRILDDATQKKLELVGEVSLVKAILEKTREELQNELFNVYNKAESAANDWKKEKEVVSSLTKDVEALENQVLKEKEGRETLIAELEELTRSNDQMNQKASMLSRNLEVANSQISTIEKEKETLYGSLVKQKKVSKEARENLEDAHDLVMRLGKERKNLDKLSKKLEEELASTSAKYYTSEEEPN